MKKGESQMYNIINIADLHWGVMNEEVHSDELQFIKEFFDRTTVPIDLFVFMSFFIFSSAS